MQWDTKTSVVINSGARQGSALSSRLKDELISLGCSDASIHIVAPEKIKETLRRVVEQKPSVLVVGGGDGTVAGSLPSLIGSDTTLGIIPLGTGNSFARALGIPLDPIEAARTISGATARRIAVGQANDVYFLSSASFGLSSKIAASISDRQKGIFGRMAYIFSGLHLVFQHKPFDCVISHEGKEHYIQTYQVIVANSPLHTFAQAPKNASVYSSALICVALGTRRSLWKYAQSSLEFFGGLEHRGADTFEIKGEEFLVNTVPSHVVDIDGEPLTETPVRFRVLSEALSVLVPKR